MKSKSHNGFSLIELLVVIAIIAAIIGLALPNYLGARGRARDARRKGEMNNLKTALQLYNNDYKAFPLPGGSPPTGIAGCGANGDILCPATCTIDFAAGGAGCDTVYMTKFPGELGTSMLYFSDGTNFCLKVSLENASDSDIAVSQDRCAAKCSGLGNTDYAVCSE